MPLTSARGNRAVNVLYCLEQHRALQRNGERSAQGRVSRASPVQTAVRNCTRDEGGPFEAGSQVLASSYRKLLSSKAMVVSVAETPGQDSGRHG
jgi:hypothetical protein